MASIIKVDSILDSQGNAFDGSQLANVGKVLQVVTYQHPTQTLITTQTVTTIFSTTFTPKSSTSKILIMVTGPWRTTSSSYVNPWGGIGVYRDNTMLYNPNRAAYGGHDSTGHYFGGDAAIQLYDTPNTTSTITYYVKARAWNSGDQFTFPHYENNSPGYAQITLMEIGV